MEAVGSIELLLALFGGLALVGLMGGGSDNENDDDNDVVRDDDVEPDVVLPALNGTEDADRLFGDDETGDIFGNDGNDFIVSGAATGAIEGGDGDDGIVLSEGTGTLTGGAGADLFIIAGNADVDGLTEATITDFDPAEDQVVLTQNLTSPENQQEIYSARTQLRFVETETEDGLVTEVFLEPRGGFEDGESADGFSSVKLLNVSEADIELNSDFFLPEVVVNGAEKFATQEERLAYFERFAEASRAYDFFHIVEEDANLTSVSDDTDAIFGNDSDETLSFPTEGTVDLFGGGGNDFLPSYNGKVLDGGPGDDTLVGEGEVLTGGEGVDTFEVREGILDTTNGTSVITDFDPSAETLLIRNFTTGDPEGLIIPSDSLQFTEAEYEGVSGTLVTSVVRDERLDEDYVGATVFLQGVSPDEIPEGAISVALW